MTATNPGILDKIQQLDLFHGSIPLSYSKYAMIIMISHTPFKQSHWRENGKHKPRLKSNRAVEGDMIFKLSLLHTSVYCEWNVLMHLQPPQGLFKVGTLLSVKEFHLESLIYLNDSHINSLDRSLGSRPVLGQKC